uniref:F-box domain-containing protein n=1 Tax=Rhizophagus irregularis (strain DAOM 181602 / DAOM 197198 / MUCL 43194) TaxID=747089 RepID=U9SKX7_RHIID
MEFLVKDVLVLIFTELLGDLDSLHSCSLVNKTWCELAMPLLWKNSYQCPYKYKKESREKYYNVIAHFLPNNPEDPLPQNKIVLPLNKFPKGPMLEYMNYIALFTPACIEDMEKLTLFPNAKRIFSNLHSLKIHHEKFINSNTSLTELGKICQDLRDLDVRDCQKDTLDLALFIKIQKNLQSLCLAFDEEEGQYNLLSDVIKEKAVTLKKISIRFNVTLISPIVIPSLENIQHLVLNNICGESYRSAKWDEWEHNLSTASFPNLQYLETLYLPISIIRLIIEKSGKDISEINICLCPPGSRDYKTDNKQLIKAISIYCPKLKFLAMDIDNRNLGEMFKIFLNCTQLEKVTFSTNANSNIPSDGDELLKVMNQTVPTTLHEITFREDWIFSLEELELFIEDWKSKISSPIKFTLVFDESLWTDDHAWMAERYMEELQFVFI